VAREGLPILWAEKSEPLDAEDSGWQFVCNSGRTEDETQAQVWSIDEVLALEPSLATFVSSTPGTRLLRANQRSAWQVSTVH